MILVCSATGKVGRELVKQLNAANVNFKAASSDLERARKTLGTDVNLVKIDYSDASTFAFALDGVDRLFILHPQDTPNRIVQLRAFVDAAKEAGVKQAVVMSALGADRRENDGMYQLEKYVAQVGIETTVLRPNWFMQNFSYQDIRSIKERNEIFLPSDNHKFSFIDTRDIAAVAAKILLEGGHAGKAYTLMGGEALSYPEVAAKISALLGREIRHNSPTVADELQRMRDANYPEEMREFMAWLFEDIHSGYTATFTNDVETVLGRAPRKISDFLQEHADLWHN